MMVSKKQPPSPSDMAAPGCATSPSLQIESDRVVPGWLLWLLVVSSLLLADLSQAATGQDKPSPKGTSKSSAKPTAPSAPPKPPEPPKKSLYDEVVEALREQYAEPGLLTPTNLERAAIDGVVASLGDSVRILPEDKAKAPTPLLPSINGVAVLEPAIGHVRVNRFDDESASRLKDEIQTLIREKAIVGLILDLRFSDGDGFAAIPVVASLFLGQSVPLFQLQRGKSSLNYSTQPAAENAVVPLAVLINRQTRGAPEILAAVLQEKQRALLIGSAPTAGAGFETSDIRLSNGDILRLATGRITLAGRGDFFRKSVEPDVLVEFDSALETAIHIQPFEPPKPRVEKRVMSEAILTGRERPPPFAKDPAPEVVPEAPTNRDLVLLNAMDLLKSIHLLGLNPPRRERTD